MRVGLGLAALLVAVVASTPSAAHEGPRDQERRLTREIEAAGGAADGPTLLARAMAYRDEGELPEAERDLAAAELAAPPADEGLVAIERARIAFDRGDDLRALGAYDATLRLEKREGRAEPRPLFAVALAERAVTNERLERWDAARADWDAAFAAHPTAEAALARGAIDELRGELDRAVQGYRDGMAETPSMVLARALARVLLARGDAEEVIGLCDDAVETVPLRAEWLLIRADALDVAGSPLEAEADREAAEDEVDRAMATRPSDLRRLLRARVWLARGRAAEAAREAAAVVKARPALVEASDLAREARAAAEGAR